jgi:O-antigen ligase
MAQDYPLWGIGFGAFQTIYELYRKPHELPAAYVHDDWLETRVCGGWISFGLVVIATGSLVFRVAACRATAVPRSTLWLISLGMVTVLVNAAIDLPFRVYSVQWLAAVLVAVLFRLSTGEVRIPRRLGNTKPIA